jgi:hypothetical protein
MYDSTLRASRIYLAAAEPRKCILYIIIPTFSHTVDLLTLFLTVLLDRVSKSCRGAMVNSHLFFA